MSSLALASHFSEEDRKSPRLYTPWLLSPAVLLPKCVGLIGVCHLTLRWSECWNCSIENGHCGESKKFWTKEKR